MFHDGNIRMIMKEKENSNLNKHTKKHECSSTLEDRIKKSQEGKRDMKMINNTSRWQGVIESLGKTNFK